MLASGAREEVRHAHARGTSETARKALGFQELLVGENAPPQALRAAQLWLRDLSDDEEQQFLNRHPQLAAEYARRVAEGDPPGRRGAGFAGGLPGAMRPYAHPEFWAPFIAVGV